MKIYIPKQTENDTTIQITQPSQSISSISITKGQLTNDNKINGLGRKITLKPFNYYKGIIIDYVPDDTYIEEGEFTNS